MYMKSSQITNLHKKKARLTVLDPSSNLQILPNIWVGSSHARLALKRHNKTETSNKTKFTPKGFIENLPHNHSTKCQKNNNSIDMVWKCEKSCGGGSLSNSI